MIGRGEGPFDLSLFLAKGDGEDVAKHAADGLLEFDGVIRGGREFFGKGLRGVKFEKPSRSRDLKGRRAFEFAGVAAFKDFFLGVRDVLDGVAHPGDIEVD